MKLIYRDAGWLYEQYVVNGLTQAEMAELADCTDACVSQWMKRHNIAVRSQAPHLDSTVHDRDWLESEYRTKSMEQIADEQGCVYSVVEHWIHKFNLPTRDAVGQDTYDIDEDWLREQYATKAAEQIAEEIGCTAWTIHNRLDRFGIEKRDKGAAMSLAHVNERGAYGTEEYRQSISEAKTYLTDEQRKARERQGSREHHRWRHVVLHRDNCVCQHCLGVGWIAHHLQSFADYPSLRYEPVNGITLCPQCHRDFHNQHGYGHNTQEQFTKFTSMTGIVNA